jgi:hypothetical protein
MSEVDRLTRRDPHHGRGPEELGEFPGLSKSTDYKIVLSAWPRPCWRISRDGCMRQAGDEGYELVGGLYAAENPKVVRQRGESARLSNVQT